MFDRLVEDNKVPLSVTFVGILCACSHSGLVDKGLEYFRSMSGDYDIIPTLIHHNCMIDLMGRAGQLDRALAFMAETPHFPTMEMWLAVLGACRKWGNVELGRQAFKHALLVDETEGAAYICMSNIYADAGMLDDARKVEALRIQKQAWKEKQTDLWLNLNEYTHAIPDLN
ncbi:hypothetical protein GOP47_0000066 [Adiantum capillus-veneris]|uniref:Pentatricopeptide repeat-containing protein n=1 Tax=Adiantum capillus-veneris TaxID=13818 RepID=A0A9D4VCV4_ADICA|nr:hypothetical protein GOP47_0000066 [Adiantum capillus-veneris]